MAIHRAFLKKCCITTSGVWERKSISTHKCYFKHLSYISETRFLPISIKPWCLYLLCEFIVWVNWVKVYKLLGQYMKYRKTFYFLYSVCIYLLAQCFSNFNVHNSQLEILLKCRYWLSRSGRGLRFCISEKHWHDVCAAGPHSALGVAKIQAVIYFVI